MTSKKTPKPSEIRPHDGTVLAGAIHLQLTDQLIRQRLKAMQDANPVRFREMAEKINLSGGWEALRDLCSGQNPIPHPLRVMLATIFDIECQFSEDEAKILRAGI